ncbi:MAG: hypothetical protein J7639_33010 [Paenibacillaceae bacterium]|nr:hypothetical protein [Paenibacillaceae bacterium]
MRKRRLLGGLLAALLMLAPLPLGGKAGAAEAPIVLFTPYTSISVPPGEVVSYDIQAINGGTSIQSVDLAVKMPSADWKYELTAGGKTISRLSVKPNEPQSLSLQVTVPQKIDKGDYAFGVLANGATALPLNVTISEQGTFNTEATVAQPNVEGHADATFSYSMTIKNRTLEKQLYALKSDVPQGWTITYNVSDKSVTSVPVDPGNSETVSITLDPPDQIKAGSYKIPVTIAGSGTQSNVELEAVVTGSYGLTLGTPSGVLSTDITSGKTRKLTLQVTNSGSADLKDVQLSTSAPVDWEVSFAPQKIDNLAAGQSAQVEATIKASGKSIAGDYVVQMTASSPEKSADAQFRVAVKTSMLWGWIGVIIILLVAGGIYYLFRKYGRR